MVYLRGKGEERGMGGLREERIEGGGGNWMEM